MDCILFSKLSLTDKQSEVEIEKSKNSPDHSNSIDESELPNFSQSVVTLKVLDLMDAKEKKINQTIKNFLPKHSKEDIKKNNNKQANYNGKDETYIKKRIENNEAAKKSRDVKISNFEDLRAYCDFHVTSLQSEEENLARILTPPQEKDEADFLPSFL